MADPKTPDEDPRGRFRRFGRRILGDEADGPRRFNVDVKEMVGAVLEGGDKAKTEIVKAVAREVRTYLEELGLKDDLNHLLTNYALEAKVSLNLRRLSNAEKGEADAAALAGVAERAAATPAATSPSPNPPDTASSE